MSNIHVIYQHDNNYAVYGGVSMLSLFQNNRQAEEINVYLIDMGLNDTFKSQYRQMADAYHRTVQFIPADTIVGWVSLNTGARSPPILNYS